MSSNLEFFFNCTIGSEVIVKSSDGLHLGGFCLLVKLAQGGSVINRATLSSQQTRAKPGSAQKTPPWLTDSLTISNPEVILKKICFLLDIFWAFFWTLRRKGGGVEPIPKVLGQFEIVLRQFFFLMFLGQFLVVCFSKISF